MDFVVVIDFEATCDANQRIGEHVNQIIEFAAVLLNLATRQTVGTFHTFCQPTGALRVLSQYCLDLTGVRQAQVDAAPEFPQVLRNFDAWLTGYSNCVIDHTSIFTNCIMASDSMYDYTIYLYNQCRISGLPYPQYALNILTVASVFKRHILNVSVKTPMRDGILRMLEHFGMRFEGSRHSALDDTRNLARVVVRMVQDGLHDKLQATITVRPTESRQGYRYMPQSCSYTDLMRHLELDDYFGFYGSGFLS